MTHRIKVGFVTIAGLAATLALAGCGGGGSENSDEIRIGAIFDLTGPTADVGTHYADGVRGFVEWTNSQGGIAGRPIDLAFQDYGYDVGRAEQLYSQYVQRGVVAFMGWGTGDTEALRQRIIEDQIPFTSASLSHVLGDPAVAPYNFLTATTYSDQFVIVLDFIKELHEEGGLPGRPRVALMHNASPFGLSPWQQGGEAYAAEIEVDAQAYEMSRGATDFTAELTQIRQSGAQYVVFQNTSGPVALALRNARSLGLNATFFCLNWCANELLIDLANEAAEGVVGSMPFAPLSMSVEGTRDIRAYLEGEGIAVEEMSNAFTQGWWTMAVMAEGIRRTLEAGQELTGPNIKSALEMLDGFDTGGVSVPLTFGPDDHRGSKGLRLFVVEDGAWRPISDFRAVGTDR
jgi:branched-chain amino acid transport system substrate-binding protein